MDLTRIRALLVCEDSLHEVCPAGVHRHAGEGAAGVRIVDGAALAHEIGQEHDPTFADIFGESSVIR